MFFGFLCVFLSVPPCLGFPGREPDAVWSLVDREWCYLFRRECWWQWRHIRAHSVRPDTHFCIFQLNASFVYSLLYARWNCFLYSIFSEMLNLSIHSGFITRVYELYVPFVAVWETVLESAIFLGIMPLYLLKGRCMLCSLELNTHQLCIFPQHCFQLLLRWDEIF